MQKEELLRRIKIFAVAATSAFVLLVIGLLVQFGVIAHQNQERTELRRQNAELQQKIDEYQQSTEYWQGDGKDDLAQQL